MSSTSNMGRRRKQRRDGAFTATDGFGGSHQIEIFTELLADGVEGERSFLTADGEAVERLAKGHYRINHGGLNLSLQSEDPAAL